MTNYIITEEQIEEFKLDDVEFDENLPDINRLFYKHLQQSNFSERVKDCFELEFSLEQTRCEIYLNLHRLVKVLFTEFEKNNLFEKTTLSDEASFVYDVVYENFFSYLKIYHLTEIIFAQAQEFLNKHQVVQ
jgi:hypothetical protein